MNRVLLTGALSVGLATGVAAVAHADIVYTNGFSANANGFTGGTITTAPSGESFLEFGGAGGSATLTLTGLVPHTSVQLAFALYAVGSMDGDGFNGAPIYGGGPGDYFNVTYSSATGSGSVFHQAYANYGSGEVQSFPVEGSAPGTGGVLNGLGYTGFPANAGIQDAEYALTLSPIADSNGSFSFTFTDNSNEGMGNEFYGIDNVVVTTDGVPTTLVPEPASFALLGAGMMSLVLRRRNTRQG